MRRKRWIVTALVAGLVMIAATGGAVLAGGAGGGAPGEGILSRVAAILGIEEQQVRDAFEQAATEVRDEQLQSKLDGLVESGRLTQEQADEYLEWQQTKPDGLFGGTPLPGLRGNGRFGGKRFGRHGHGWGRFKQAPEPAPDIPDTTSF